jgi:hypothetical protein
MKGYQRNLQLETGTVESEALVNCWMMVSKMYLEKKL